MPNEDKLNEKEQAKMDQLLGSMKEVPSQTQDSTKADTPLSQDEGKKIVEDYMTKGNKEMSAQNYDLAITNFENALNLDSIDEEIKTIATNNIIYCRNKLDKKEDLQNLAKITKPKENLEAIVDQPKSETAKSEDKNDDETYVKALEFKIKGFDNDYKKMKEEFEAKITTIEKENKEKEEILEKKLESAYEWASPSIKGHAFYETNSVNQKQIVTLVPGVAYSLKMWITDDILNDAEDSKVFFEITTSNGNTGKKSIKTVCAKQIPGQSKIIESEKESPIYFVSGEKVDTVGCYAYINKKVVKQ